MSVPIDYGNVDVATKSGIAIAVATDLFSIAGFYSAGCSPVKKNNIQLVAALFGNIVQDIALIAILIALIHSLLLPFTVARLLVKIFLCDY